MSCDQFLEDATIDTKTTLSRFTFRSPLSSSNPSLLVAAHRLSLSTASANRNATLILLLNSTTESDDSPSLRARCGQLLWTICAGASTPFTDGAPDDCDDGLEGKVEKIPVLLDAVEVLDASLGAGGGPDIIAAGTRGADARWTESNGRSELGAGGAYFCASKKVEDGRLAAAVVVVAFIIYRYSRNRS